MFAMAFLLAFTFADDSVPEAVLELKRRCEEEREAAIKHLTDEYKKAKALIGKSKTTAEQRKRANNAREARLKLEAARKSAWHEHEPPIDLEKFGSIGAVFERHRDRDRLAIDFKMDRRNGRVANGVLILYGPPPPLRAARNGSVIATAKPKKPKEIPVVIFGIGNDRVVGEKKPLKGLFQVLRTGDEIWLKQFDIGPHRSLK